MSTLLPRQNTSIASKPARDASPRRLIVTASAAAFAIRDWSLWVLLRDGPWGPPMRLVLGTETVTDAVERTLEALLLWPTQSSLIQLKAGWQEQQVYVWGSTEQGSAVSLIHSMLLRPHRDELRPNLRKQPVPSLHVQWVPVADVEAGRRTLDADVRPGFFTALHALRSHVQREPDLILRYLADMAAMPSVDTTRVSWKSETASSNARTTLPLNIIQEPPPGDGTMTLAEAALLYRAFFPADEPIDLSNLRRRFLSSNRLKPLDEERPVRNRETDWRRMSRAYLYQES